MESSSGRGSHASRGSSSPPPRPRSPRRWASASRTPSPTRWPSGPGRRSRARHPRATPSPTGWSWRSATRTPCSPGSRRTAPARRLRGSGRGRPGRRGLGLRERGRCREQDDRAYDGGGGSECQGAAELHPGPQQVRGTARTAVRRERNERACRRGARNEPVCSSCMTCDMRKRLSTFSRKLYVVLATTGWAQARWPHLHDCSGGGSEARPRWPEGGRSRASPGPAAGVTGPLSPADRSHTPDRGPTTHLGCVTRPGGATRGFLPLPPLAGTDTRTNEGARGPVTLRTGETGPERGCGRTAFPDVTSDSSADVAPGRSGRHTRPRHSSSSVMARAVPGLPRASL